MADKKTILIVEDEEDQRAWMTAFFEDHGYNVITAENGQIGFEVAKQKKPDLITLDISMDNESGIGMFRNYVDSDEVKDIPVIMVTGVSPDFKRLLDRGKLGGEPAGYFEKPVERDDLLKKVRELIG